jgi:hypothetical protein
LIKSLLKPSIRRALESKPALKVLDLEVVQRALGGSFLYPDWERRARLKAKKWKHGFPDWAALLRDEPELWQSALDSARNGPRILMGLGASGYSSIATIETYLAVALTLRGARVHVLVCDEHLPICYIQQITAFSDSHRFARHGPSRTQCVECFRPGLAMLEGLGIATHRHSELISLEEVDEAKRLAETVPADEIRNFDLDGVRVGEQAYAGALRYYTRADLSGEPDGDAVLRRYFRGALMTAFGTRRLLEGHAFSRMCFHHGMYVPHGVYNAVAKNLDVPVVSWTAGYRDRTFIFSHADTYHLTMLDEPVSNWELMAWDHDRETAIVDYLKSRWEGTQDWVSYQKNTRQDVAGIAAEIGFDPAKPSVALLTNVLWDAQVHYTGNAFPDMLTWLIETVRYFETRPDLQLLIRAHPAERRSRQQIGEELARVFPCLPENVFFIPPDYPANTYAILEHCDAAIIYATKAGIEATSMGIPVIVAGESWIRNKGISMDASSPDEYRCMLDRLPFGERLDPQVVQRARRFAYHFFLRRMIPLRHSVADWPNLRLDLASLRDMLPGSSVGLDVICDGILNGEDFIYPADQGAGAFDEPALAPTGGLSSADPASAAGCGLGNEIR